MSFLGFLANSGLYWELYLQQIKTAIETEKDKGTFSFQTPSFYRILIIISNALDRTNSITLRNCKIRAASCGKTYCFRPRQGKSEICERVWKSPSTKEVLNRVNRQPSNGLNLNQQPSIMQIKINHKKVVRYFKSRDFNQSLQTSGPWKIYKLVQPVPMRSKKILSLDITRP